MSNNKNNTHKLPNVAVPESEDPMNPPSPDENQDADLPSSIESPNSMYQRMVTPSSYSDQSNSPSPAHVVGVPQGVQFTGPGSSDVSEISYISSPGETLYYDPNVTMIPASPESSNPSSPGDIIQATNVQINQQERMVTTRPLSYNASDQSNLPSPAHIVGVPQGVQFTGPGSSHVSEISYFSSPEGIANPVLNENIPSTHLVSVTQGNVRSSSPDEIHKSNNSEGYVQDTVAMDVSYNEASSGVAASHITIADMPSPPPLQKVLIYRNKEGDIMEHSYITRPRGDQVPTGDWRKLRVKSNRVTRKVENRGLRGKPSYKTDIERAIQKSHKEAMKGTGVLPEKFCLPPPEFRKTLRSSTMQRRKEFQSEGNNLNKKGDDDQEDRAFFLPGGIKVRGLKDPRYLSHIANLDRNEPFRSKREIQSLNDHFQRFAAPGSQRVCISIPPSGTSNQVCGGKTSSGKKRSKPYERPSSNNTMTTTIGKLSIDSTCSSGSTKVSLGSNVSRGSTSSRPRSFRSSPNIERMSQSNMDLSHERPSSFRKQSKEIEKEKSTKAKPSTGPMTSLAKKNWGSSFPQSRLNKCKSEARLFNAQSMEVLGSIRELDVEFSNPSEEISPGDLRQEAYQFVLGLGTNISDQEVAPINNRDLNFLTNMLKRDAVIDNRLVKEFDLQLHNKVAQHNLQTKSNEDCVDQLRQNKRLLDFISALLVNTTSEIIDRQQRVSWESRPIPATNKDGQVDVDEEIIYENHVTKADLINPLTTLKALSTRLNKFCSTISPLSGNTNKSSAQPLHSGNTQQASVTSPKKANKGKTNINQNDVVLDDPKGSVKGTVFEIILGLPNNQVWAKFDGHSIDCRSAATWLPNFYLSDEAIDHQGVLIQYDSQTEGNETIPVQFLPTAVFTSYIDSKTLDMQFITGMINNISSQTRYIFAPICMVKAAHYILAIIDCDLKSVRIYDPLCTDGPLVNEEYQSIIIHVTYAADKTLDGDWFPSGLEFNLSAMKPLAKGKRRTVKDRKLREWAKNSNFFTHLLIPLQTDSTECGVYIIAMMDAISNRNIWRISDRLNAFVKHGTSFLRASYFIECYERNEITTRDPLPTT